MVIHKSYVHNKINDAFDRVILFQLLYIATPIPFINNVNDPAAKIPHNKRITGEFILVSLLLQYTLTIIRMRNIRFHIDPSSDVITLY